MNGIEGLPIDPASVWLSLSNHLWQSTVFAILLLPFLALLRRGPARLRYSLGLVTLGKFVLPSTLLFLILRSASPGLGERLPTLPGLALDLEGLLGFLLPSGGQGASASRGLPAAAYLALLSLWMVGSVLLLTRWMRRRRSFIHNLRSVEPLNEGPVWELLETVRLRLGLQRPVPLLALRDAPEVGVWGVRKPVIVMPREMPDHLQDDELEAVFTHELLHVQRRDNLVANLQMALCCLFWFHPLVWILDRWLLQEREEACDERAVALCGGGAKTYAKGLVKAARFGIDWHLAGVSSAGASNLRRRIERIQAGAFAQQPSLFQRGLVGACVACLLAFSLVAGTSGTLPACTSSAEELSADEGCAVTKGTKEIRKPEVKVTPPAEAPPYYDCTESQKADIEWGDEDVPLVSDGVAGVGIRSAG